MDELPYNCVGTTSYPLRKKIKSDPYVRICTKKKFQVDPIFKQKKIRKKSRRIFQ